jgi:hypothetical protein
MISVQESYPEFAAKCHLLQPGESSYSARAEIPYDIHCYADGWFAYWKSPPNGQLGRHLRTREELGIFLNGRWAVGRPVRTILGLRQYLRD